MQIPSSDHDHERRAARRHRTVYRPAYIRADDKIHFVTMRDVSPDGARFDGLAGLTVGQEIHYCVGDSEPILALVKWTDGNSFGVANAVEWIDDLNEKSGQDYRSVRLPVMASVDIYFLGYRFEGFVRNLSQRGACIETSIFLQTGELLTLEFGGLSLEGSEVRWVEDTRAGVRFAKALDVKSISQALEKIQCRKNSRATPTEIAA